MDTATFRRVLVAGVAAVRLLLPPCASAQGAHTDSLSQARELARSGKQTEAVALLTSRLAGAPDDSDARTLRGTLLSWQGRYGEARLDLERVLSAEAVHADALPALARVELWDGRPARADELVARGLAARPDDFDLMELRALALEGLGRIDDALRQVNGLLNRQPERESALRLRRRLIERRPAWFAEFSGRGDRFDDGRAPWHETQLALTRQAAGGSLGARLSAAERFGQSDTQIEIDAYPHLGARTYAYVSAGASSRATLYPRWRLGADLYQPLGAGWEVAGGLRALNFSPRVNVYTAALAKYQGNWLFSARVWLAPATSRREVTGDYSVRRYRRDGESFWALRFTRGQYRDDFHRFDLERLHSNAAAMEVVQRMGRLLVGGTLRTSREERTATNAFWQTTVTVTSRVRF